MSLLPRPHARSRALSLDTGTRVSVDLGIPTVKSSLAPSISSYLPGENPSFSLLRGLLRVSSNASVSALPKGAALPAFPTLINIRASPKAPQKDNSSLQKAPAAVSYLLPQGLLDLTFKMSLHSVPDISLVDLILHGLLDPIPESLALYRNAVMQANQMNLLQIKLILRLEQG
ncbi:hypothetical protein BDP27DRAFT_1438245 [Rhodocollybia butyracea]|uniref:Uncharacterized protein n=1 Tax=Rhodocollybia butyracea TaxID=206335 RepID=A0A9P5TVQ9_9AGAR|nr:hypothetical protein BDP27DRAFT_1438245 [Rhodocollybia butyracea]